MARKRTKKQRSSVGQLGKDLTRRSRGKCELCDSKGGGPFELWPFPDEPSMDRTLMACERCKGWLEQGEVSPAEAYFLSAAVWHEEPAVKLAAARLLLRCDDPDSPWMRDALEAVDIDPATGEFAI